jgi:hypothetical protein
MMNFTTATGPELAAWAAEHVMGWKRIDLDDQSPGWGTRRDSGLLNWECGEECFSPHTSWNDAIRVARECDLWDAHLPALGSFILLDHTPLDLLRYVCEQMSTSGNTLSDAGAGREAKR